MTLPAGAPDPFKGLRGIFAATLGMEAIVVALALLVVPRFGYAGVAGTWYVVGLAVAMAVAAGLQRRRWGLGLALLLQVAMVAGVFAHYSLAVAGLLFCLVWAYLLHVRRTVARRMAEGSLPAQQDASRYSS